MAGEATIPTNPSATDMDAKLSDSTNTDVEPVLQDEPLGQAKESVGNHEGAIPSSPPKSGGAPRDARFWLIMTGLILAVIISALDGSALSTALPTIVAEFNLGPDYVWVVNIFFLTQTVVQPFFGQLSDLWGRRWIFISSVAVFVLGSGLIAGASSGTMLIAARGVQGVGAGGINMMADMIVCDLVPLRDRSAFMGLIFGLGAGVAAVIGPLIAGALTSAGAWRWLFWLNLPVGAISIAVMFIWLRVSHRRQGSTIWRLKRIDWIGTAILTGSTVAILYSLAYGDAVKPWSDGAVIAGLTAGHAGLVLFVLWEGSPWCGNPLMPLRLFRNRTSAAALFLTVTNAILIFWAVYMFPVYFQAVLGGSPRDSGFWLLPLIVAFPVGTVISGGVTAKLGRYKPLHVVGFALCALTWGLCSILDENTHKAVWVVFQLIMALGISLPIACLLPCVQAPLSDEDTAASTGTWAFLRSFGSIWGVAIPAAIFNDRFAQLEYLIEDEATRAALSGGRAYGQASSSLTDALSDPTRGQVVQVYNMSLQRVWQIGVVFAGVSVLVALIEKEVPMRQELETDFGLEEPVKEKPKIGDV
jgi:MFS family permease